jgi:DNA-binding transcriptional ArsR family regulator
MDGFSALADPTRRQILELLAQGQLDAGSISSHFSISKPGISRHLKVLREAGIVDVEVAAQRRLYSVRTEGLADVETWLARYRGFWDERLDALARAARKDTDE